MKNIKALLQSQRQLPCKKDNYRLHQYHSRTQINNQPCLYAFKNQTNSHSNAAAYTRFFLLIVFGSIQAIEMVKFQVGTL